MNQAQRKRRENGERSQLSSWHFGAQFNNTEQTLNNLKEINKLGSKYAQDKDPADAEKLIAAFHNYIMKYVNLLTNGWTGNQPKLTSDTQRFLCLWVPSSSYNNRQELFFEFSKVIKRLPNSFLNLEDADGIYNELVIIFLTLAQRFNPDIGGFTGFIQHHFKFQVKARMHSVQSDALNYQPLVESTAVGEDFDKFGGLDCEVIDGTIRVLFQDVIGENGVYEIVDDYFDLPILDYSFISRPIKPFDTIWTQDQRAVIVYKYKEGLSFTSIGKKLWGVANAAHVRKLHTDAIDAYRHFMRSSK